MKKVLSNSAFVVFAIMLVLSSTNNYAQSTWKAPKSADDIQNPLKADPTAIKEGKKLYVQFCAICHGDKGKGDGMAGAALNPRPAKFNTKLFTAQTDGAIFWKLSEGRPPMAPYKDTFTKVERWQLVNYIRSLSKN